HDLAHGDGRLSNLYGRVPAVHRYSGYGSDTEAKDPADLAREIMGKIVDELISLPKIRRSQQLRIDIAKL
ncbi:hypothetical protein LCGC14_2905840, partial [marine sediment metagenome]